MLRITLELEEAMNWLSRDKTTILLKAKSIYQYDCEK